MGKERNPEGGKTRLAEEINAQYHYNILCRMPNCVPSTRPVGNGGNYPHAPAGGFNRDNIVMARYFTCRACRKKQNVSGYLKLAREQLPLPTLAAIARNVLQNHTSDLPDVSQLEKIVREYERLLPPSASTPAMATLPTSSHVVSRQTSDLSISAQNAHTSIAAPRTSSSALVPPYVPDQMYISSPADSDSDLDSLPDATTRKRRAEPASDSSDGNEPLPKRRPDDATTNGDDANDFWSDVIGIVSPMRLDLDRITTLAKADMSGVCPPPAAASAIEAFRSSAAEFIAATTTPATIAMLSSASASAALPDASPLTSLASIRSLFVDRFNKADGREARARVLDEMDHFLALSGEEKFSIFMRRAGESGEQYAGRLIPSVLDVISRTP